MARKKVKEVKAGDAVLRPKTYYSLKELAKDFHMTDPDDQVAGGDIAVQATELARQIVSAAAEHHLRLPAVRV